MRKRRPSPQHDHYMPGKTNLLLKINNAQVRLTLDWQLLEWIVEQYEQKLIVQQKSCKSGLRTPHTIQSDCSFSRDSDPAGQFGWTRDMTPPCANVWTIHYMTMTSPFAPPSRCCSPPPTTVVRSSLHAALPNSSLRTSTVILGW